MARRIAAVGVSTALAGIGFQTSAKAAGPFDHVDIGSFLDPYASSFPPGGGAAGGSGQGLTAEVGTLPGDFSVSPDGVAHYSIPLDVPPGANGYAPRLSIDYSSAVGDGILGVGFSLSGLPEITRCNENIAMDGEVAHFDWGDDDRLCFNGQRLVLDSGEYGKTGSTYRTRVDGFSRITLQADAGAATSAFVVETKSGEKLHLGEYFDSKVQGDGVTYRWRISRREDRFGNYIRYHYAYDYPVDENGSVSTLDTLDHRISEIWYTGNGRDLPQRSIEFTYSVDRTVDGFVAGAQTRTSHLLDKIATYGPDDEQVHEYRLTYTKPSITRRPLLTTATACSPDDVCLPPTNFQWEHGSLQEADTEPLPDTYANTNIPWPHPEPTWSYNNLLGSEQAAATIGDFTGDGVLDVIAATYMDIFYEPDGLVSDQPWFIWPSHGPNEPYDLGNPWEPIRVDPGGGYTDNLFGNNGEWSNSASRRFQIVSHDFGLDGYSDLLFPREGNTCSTGQGWENCAVASRGWRWIEFENGGYQSLDIDAPHFFGLSINPDLDGDSRPDFLFCGDDRWWFGLFDGSTTPEFIDLGVECNAYDEVAAFDWDGDGDDDVLVVPKTSGGLHVDEDQRGHYRRLLVDTNEGTAQLGPEVLDRDLLMRFWYPEMTEGQVARPEYLSGMASWKFGDFNGDGLTDFLRLESLGGVDEQDGYDDLGSIRTSKKQATQVRVWWNTGDGMERGDVVLSYPTTGYNRLDKYFSRYSPIDWDADGKTDMVIPTTTNSPNGGFLEILYADGTLEPLDEGEAWMFNLIPSVGPPQARLDINGDGLEDLVFRPRGDHEWEILEHQGRVPDMLVWIENGLQETIDVTYDVLTKDGVYEQELTCSFPQNCIKGPRQVVRRHTQDLGLDDDSLSHVYAYRNGRADVLGNGSQGFEETRVTISNSDGPLSTRLVTFDNTTFDEGLGIYPFARHPKRTIDRVYLPGLGVERVTVSDRDYTALETIPGAHFVREDRVSHESREFGVNCDENCWSDDLEFELNANAPFRTSYTLFSHDAFGNRTQEENYIDTPGGTWVDSVLRSVSNDPSAWVLGQIDHVRSMSTKLGGVPRWREASYEYDPTTHALARTIVEPSDDQYMLETWVSRDQWGNVVSSMTHDADWNWRGGVSQYDAEGVFPTNLWNSLGHETRIEWIRGFGLPRLVRDPNGVVTEAAYDGFGRLVHQRNGANDGAVWTDDTLDITYRRIFDDPLTWHTQIETEVGGGGIAIDDFDRLGRPTRSQWTGLGGEDRYQTTTYNNLGLTETVSLPTFVGNAPTGERAFEYDNARRLVFDINPDGTATEFEHFPMAERETDPNGNQRTAFIDRRGLITSILDADLTTMCFDYGAFGDLETVTRNCNGQADPMTISVETDRFGRTTRLDDPQLGRRDYQYSPFGELIYANDEDDLAETYFEYDELGRLTWRGTDDGDTEFAYDIEKLGLLSRSDSDTGIRREFFYDDFSRLSRSTMEVDARFYQMELEYDAYGRLSVLDYPRPLNVSKFRLEHIYDTGGNLGMLRNDTSKFVYWQIQDADDAGRVTSELFGNGVASDTNYDLLTGRVESVGTYAQNLSPLQQIGYQWDDAGNLLQRADGLHNQQEDFTYDALNRLKTAAATKGGSAKSEFFNYDRYGNIEFKSDIGAYSYDAQGRLQTAGSKLFDFDARGRMTSEVDGLEVTRFHWTAFDKIAEIEEPSGTTTFDYDAFGNRAARHSTVDNLTTYYFDGLYEHEIDYGQVVPTEKHKFTLSGSEGPVAQVERTASWGGFVDQTSYIHRDHLGSTDLITNENGAVAQRMSFDAWGRKRTATDWTSPLEFVNNSGVNVGYTGHEERIDGGKMNMRGRLYDPEVGRMVSADPHVPAPRMAEGWNRFAYVLNSPLGYTDPTGYDPEDFGADAPPGAPTFDEGTQFPVWGSRPGGSSGSETPAASGTAGFSSSGNEGAPDHIGGGGSGGARKPTDPATGDETPGSHDREDEPAPEVVPLYEESNHVPGWLYVANPVVAHLVGSVDLLVNVPRNADLAGQYAGRWSLTRDWRDGLRGGWHLLEAGLGLAQVVPWGSFSTKIKATVEVGETVTAGRPRSLGAAANAERHVNWSWKSVKTFGHTFKKHGAGRKRLRSLKDTARTGGEQGQWLNNEAAAQFLEGKRPYVDGPTTVEIPPGMGQVIKHDGSVVPATKAKLVPRGDGYRTAYPIL